MTEIVKTVRTVSVMCREIACVKDVLSVNVGSQNAQSLVRTCP
jgi:hypothetical protein